jgi:TfoX/Sxy family transcriptional regulator of competence genes
MFGGIGVYFNGIFFAIIAARDVSATKERKRRAPTTKADARRIHSKPAKR